MIEIFTRIKDGVLLEMIGKVSGVIPKLVAAALIFFIGSLIAKFIRNLVKRLLVGLNIDGKAESLNDIDLLHKSGMKIQPSVVVSNTLYYVLMLIFTIAATDALGIQPITDLVSDILNYLPALFSAAIVFIIGLFVSDMIKGLVVTTCQSLGMSSAKTIGTVVFYFLFMTIAISALAQAKIDTGLIATNLTVIVGAFALAFALGYGFASKDVLSNYLAGMYNKGNVRIGDEVRIIGVKGKVVMIDGTSMILQTNDRAIVIPLSKLTTEKIEVFYPDGQTENLLETGD
jgi:small-conductance mechanosensitive channel